MNENEEIEDVFEELTPYEEVAFTDEEQRIYEETIAKEVKKHIEEENSKKFREQRVKQGFTITSGLFTKNAMRQFLTMQKFVQKGTIDITWEETKGFSSLFCVEVVGPRYKVRKWVEEVERRIEQ